MPKRDLTFLGKILFATGAIKPGIPDEPVLTSIKPDTSAGYGKYLSCSVANCMGCHTARDMQTGAFIGEPYAGGMTFGPDNLTRGWTYIAPNLTPDPQTGVTAGSDEEVFVKRMKAGRVYETSPMPWNAFKKMSDNDLKAVYRYLKTVKPVKNKITQTGIPPEEKS